MRATLPSLPTSRIWRSGALGGREATWPSSPLLAWRGRRSWLGNAAALAAAGCFCAVVQGPIWIHATRSAAVNLTARSSSYRVDAPQGTGQRGAAGRSCSADIPLSGLRRLLEWVPGRPTTCVFGAVDRLFGAWALLRYPNPSLFEIPAGLPRRAGRLDAGRPHADRGDSTAQWDGAPASSWWLALIPEHAAQRRHQLCRQRGRGTLRRGTPRASGDAAPADQRAWTALSSRRSSWPAWPQLSRPRVGRDADAFHP